MVFRGELSMLGVSFSGVVRSIVGSGSGRTLLDPFVSVGWGLGQGLPGTPAERLAARRMATPQLHAALPSSDQRRMFLVSTVDSNL